MKNKSYIGIAFIILVFGILVIPTIINRIRNNDVVKGDRLNSVSGTKEEDTGSLYTVNKAPFFELTDQDGRTINNESYKGKVYVLEFFFTTCPTICPKMNANMKKVADAFGARKDFGIVSITINPENDTPAVLKAHKKALGISMENWHFLTGDRDKIFAISNKGFNLFAGESTNGANGGFEHSGLFALIDKDGNIRCRRDQYNNPVVYYDGLSPAGINDLQHDIRLLLQE
ncbi:MULTISPECIES: SCO family protein [unclassified Flavobacterium]|uniref:SCO family protein n=1 Tax=unclassified Flavobacterium TaxID=196869 RepID=UPI001F12ABCF|nr:MULTISPECIES: SCO family protein [unclassified Flavobacterium]UMY65994.1 SCO family protein [Flavobacterium sp. HJ-32-4]